MSTLALTTTVPVAHLQRIPLVPWRDPQTVPPEELAGHIARLEQACLQHPESADLRTCLGMAYAMNYEVYKSMDALELAVRLEPDHFFAQLKYAELHYRLRALVTAERETLKAVELAANAWELTLARKQLQEIRRLMREGTQKPEWTKPLRNPALVLMALIIMLSLTVIWK
jgi:cytochrome c-type biogenesis protein CcmH/NrfG